MQVISYVFNIRINVSSGVVKPWQGVAHATPVIHHATPEPPQEILTMHTPMYHGQESHYMWLN